MVPARVVAHRVRQARTAAFRVEVALTTAQVLFWVMLVVVLVALALRVLRRRTGDEGPAGRESEPIVEGSTDQV